MPRRKAARQSAPDRCDGGTGMEKWSLGQQYPSFGGKSAYVWGECMATATEALHDILWDSVGRKLPPPANLNQNLRHGAARSRSHFIQYIHRCS